MKGIPHWRGKRVSAVCRLRDFGTRVRLRLTPEAPAFALSSPPANFGPRWGRDAITKHMALRVYRPILADSKVRIRKFGNSSRKRWPRSENAGTLADRAERFTLGGRGHDYDSKLLRKLTRPGGRQQREFRPSGCPWTQENIPAAEAAPGPFCR